MLNKLVNLLKTEKQGDVIKNLKSAADSAVSHRDQAEGQKLVGYIIDVLAHLAANDLKNLIQENKALRDEKGFENLVQQEVEARVQQLAGKFEARIAELQADMETLEEANANKTVAKSVEPQPVVSPVNNSAATNDNVRRGKRHKTKNHGGYKMRF